MEESFPTTRPATYGDVRMNDLARRLRDMSFGTVSSSVEENSGRIESSIERAVLSNPQICPHCDTDRNIEVKDFSSFLENNEEFHVFFYLECQYCKYLFLLTTQFRMIKTDNEWVFPEPLNWQTYPPVPQPYSATLKLWREAGVPESALSSYSDAAKALSSDIPRAAAPLFRIALENLLRNKPGVQEGQKLFEKITSCEELSEHRKKQAHAIRNSGNAYLHEENIWVEDGSIDDANAMKLLVDRIVDDLYLHPYEESKAEKQLQNYTRQPPEESAKDNI